MAITTEISHSYTGTADARIEDVYTDTVLIQQGKETARLDGAGRLKLVQDDVPTANAIYEFGDLSSADGGISAEMLYSPGGTGNYLCGKIVDKNDFVAVRLETTCHLVKQITGTETTLSSAGITFSSGDVVGMEWAQNASPSPGADYWLTKDGTRVEGPFHVPDSDVPSSERSVGTRLTTVKVPLWDNLTAGALVTATVDAPTISPIPTNAGVLAPYTISISAGASGADSIHYTTDGTAPDETDTTYTGPFELTAAGVTEVQAIARLDSTNSAATTATYHVDALWYTIDGTDPETSGTRVGYLTGPFELVANATVRVIAELSDATWSDEAQAAYVVTVPGVAPHYVTLPLAIGDDSPLASAESLESLAVRLRSDMEALLPGMTNDAARAVRTEYTYADEPHDGRVTHTVHKRGERWLKVEYVYNLSDTALASLNGTTVTYSTDGGDTWLPIRSKALSWIRNAQDNVVLTLSEAI